MRGTRLSMRSMRLATRPEAEWLPITTSMTRSRLNGSATSSQPDIFRPETWTNEASSTSGAATSTAMTSVTSSPGSADGHSLAASPACLTTSLGGQDLALASLSAPQESAKALRTSGTFGQFGRNSSASARLQSSLESRLRARMACYGSTLYRLTWKTRVTPSQRPICALRASALRRSDSDFSGWPTPDAGLMNDGADLVKHMARVERLRAKHNNGNGAGLTLSIVAQMVGWATPAARDYRTPNLTAWRDRGGGRKGEQLSNQVVHSGPVLTGSSAEIAAFGRLSPAHSRWLMGYPAEWDACAPTATLSSRALRRSS